MAVKIRIHITPINIIKMVLHEIDYLQKIPFWKFRKRKSQIEHIKGLLEELKPLITKK